MTAEAMRTLLHRWFDEVWNQGNESTIDELLHEQGKVYGWPRTDSVLTGAAAFKTIHRQFMGAFSGIRIKIDETIIEGNRAAVRWTCSMTHTGDSLGFAATNKTITVPGASFMTIDDDKIKDGWNFLDMTRVILEIQNAANRQL